MLLSCPCTDVCGAEQRELQKDRKVGQEPNPYLSPTWFSFSKSTAGKLAALTSEANLSYLAPRRVRGLGRSLCNAPFLFSFLFISTGALRLLGWYFVLRTVLLNICKSLNPRFMILLDMKFTAKGVEIPPFFRFTESFQCTCHFCQGDFAFFPLKVILFFFFLNSVLKTWEHFKHECGFANKRCCATPSLAGVP